MSYKRPAQLMCLLAVRVLVLFPAEAFASGDNVGENLANLLKGYAGDLYGKVVTVASLALLLNRRYAKLAAFLCAAVVVAWAVFAPSEIGLGEHLR